MIELSFIVPAKNTKHYIFEMIESVIESCNFLWEIIIIDDHSEDGLFHAVSSYCKNDKRIKIFKNPGKGKVSALNEGFNKSTGKYIKCIDSDDTLDKNFTIYIKDIISSDASCHDYNIVDKSLKKIAVYSMNQKFLKYDYDYTLQKLISLPRAVWTVSRDIAEKIFPMPQGLPYEDIWFSLIIKKNVNNIRYINKPLYNYRQHAEQTFGGVLNYTKKVIIFRANRLVKLINEFEKTGTILDYDVVNKLSYQKYYYTILGTEIISLRNIFHSSLTKKDKLKVFIFRKAAWSLKALKKIQWVIDSKKTGKIK